MRDVRIIPLTGLGLLKNNVYIVHRRDSDEAVLIDASKSQDKIIEALNSYRLKLKAVLLTHGHYDHIYSAHIFEKSGAEIFIHESDRDKLHTSGNLCRVKIPDTTAEKTFRDGDVIEKCGMRFEVIHTPGHSAGSVSFRLGDVLFSGDTLFRDGYGRTDFYDGDFIQMISSVGKLLELPLETAVYPGHGPFTTIEHEREFNPLILK